jgi:hypothetical protein
MQGMCCGGGVNDERSIGVDLSDIRDAMSMFALD